MLQVITPEREPDGYGSGAFGAPRGSGRTHRGVDFVCWPGSILLSPVAGRVTTLGYPYADMTYRYVEITDGQLLRHRFFYVSPGVDVGQLVAVGDILGEVQDVPARYERRPDPMKPHVHYEVKDQANNYLDPDDLPPVSNDG